jgi:hypothetical protein
MVRLGVATGGAGGSLLAHAALTRDDATTPAAAIELLNGRRMRGEIVPDLTR